MNINPINRAYEVYKSSSTKKVEKTEGTTSKKDVLNISSEAKDFQVALTAAMKAEDVREDLVTGMKEKMGKDDYIVDTDSLVEKIMSKKR